MTKKNDKRLCWNCEGNIGFHLEKCPFCGVDLSNANPSSDKKNFTSPYASAMAATSQEVPPPAYSGFNFQATDKEWKEALAQDEKKEKPDAPEEKKEMYALLLLLPGIVLFLFGIALLLFSNEGMLRLEWNQNFAYFYFVGALPLLALGYKALK